MRKIDAPNRKEKEVQIMQWIEKRIDNHENTKDERVRSAYGKAAGVVGIAANALLCAFKLLADSLSGSVAITADAVNNLADASSSVVSLVGFKLADKPADAEHPYGHGRYEYLSALMVAVMIMVIGVELLKSSVEKIVSPAPVRLSAVTLLVLCGSIVVKVWLAAFNRAVGRRISSKALEATADDCRNDVITTSAVLVSMIVGHFSGLMLDGYIGLAVAAFILVTGFSLVKSTIDPMLGVPPTREQADAVREKLMSYPGVLGIHDLIIHDYGPGRQFASVHVEMDAKDDPLESHDMIDNIERDFLREQRLNLVIHYDPVVTDDPRVGELRELITQAAQHIHPKMSVHELRIVPGNTHVNVVFDCVVPFDCSVARSEIRERITTCVREVYPSYYCVITTENSFVSPDA